MDSADAICYKNLIGVA